MTPPENETPWMDWLYSHIGETEIAGPIANPFIVDTFYYTSLKGDPLALDDSTAWCSALACAALEKNGYLSPHSAAAASFDNYGTDSTLKYGAILTFKRQGGSGRHVTFYVGTEPTGLLRCLGGNQANSLKESIYGADNLVSIKWPIKKKA